jgi:chromosome segregation protein
VTLEGELLEKSGAMTGGSLQQRSSQLGFGSASEGDEAEPLRRRLLELGESLVACRREEGSLSDALEALRPQLQQSQQRQSALEAERKAAERSLNPHRQRSAQLGQRRTDLGQALASDGARAEEIGRLLAPLQERLAVLDQAEAAAAGEGEPSLWQGLQSELEAADLALQNARALRDGQLAQRRDRALASERLQNQLESLGQEEQRLIAAVNALLSERETWKQRQQEQLERRKALEAQQQELSTRFGEKRRARDQAESQLGAQRQALQQRQWELERLGEELVALVPPGEGATASVPG